MNFLGSLLAPLVPKLLDWVLNGIASMASWVWKKYQASSKLSKEKSEIDKQLVRVKAAIDGAFNGEEISKDQKRELIDSLRELIRGY